MGARSAMVAALTDGLPTDVRIVPDPRRMGDTLPSDLSAVVQVVLVSIEPTTTAGQLRGNFELWVVVPFSDPAAGEEKLESALDELLELLLRLSWFSFDKAERSTYREMWIAYKISGFSQLQVEE